jgi:putative transposase
MRRWLRVQRDLLRILELVRAYSVPISDKRASELITWYIKTLQKAIDLIWDNMKQRYRFPELVRRGWKAGH